VVVDALLAPVLVVRRLGREDLGVHEVLQAPEVVHGSCRVLEVHGEPSVRARVPVAVLGPSVPAGAV
jgi:hypothetical protein